MHCRAGTNESCMQCGVVSNGPCMHGRADINESCMQCGVDTNDFRRPCGASCMQCGPNNPPMHVGCWVVEPFRCSGLFECIDVSNVSSADRKTKLTLMLTEH